MTADLSTAIGPLALKNPVIAASCEATIDEHGLRACLDAGAGAVVAKSVNESPAAARQLNIAEYALLGREGSRVEWGSQSGTESLLCRSGLAQDSLDDWLAMLGRVRAHADSLGAHLIGSITVAEAEPAARIARELATVTSAVELNVGAPHGREAGAVRQLTGPELVAHYTRTVRAGLDAPLIVKLPAQSDDPLALARAARESGADAVTMIGRFTGFWPDIDSGVPVLGSAGAVGGPGMLPVSLYWAAKAFTAGATPLIGTNGARDGSDIARFLLSGACAVQLASAILLRGPEMLTECVRELDEVLTAAGYPDVRGMIGRAARRSRGYAEIPENPAPVRPWETGDT
ncbi:dihydroorotate dehydrogenase [Sciscionella marina]|uniref:dihydroorotate dehydrogenase n=1 Tax=Sciscionella marina TaxID=508770 RepID=UPI0003828F2D|nr:hypothetical protein [Sciscionella marina]